jgi:hypothetical protein
MKTALLSLFALAMVLLACNKEDNDPQTQEESVHKISCVISASPGIIPDTMWYQYDSKGRLTKETYTYKSYDTYEYGASQVTVKKYSKTNEQTGTIIYSLNSKGFVSSFSSDDGSFQYTEKNEYDSNGLLNKVTSASVNYADTAFYKYESGNMVQQISINWHNGVKSVDTSTYTFYTDKTSTIENKNYGLKYQSNLNKDLIKTIASDYSNGTFYYEFDDKTRVINKILKNGTDTLYYLKFEYTD